VLNTFAAIGGEIFLDLAGIARVLIDRDRILPSGLVSARENKPDARPSMSKKQIWRKLNNFS
jgi:hypothetical protein